jgi:hypothetical protein
MSFYNENQQNHDPKLRYMNHRKLKEKNDGENYVSILKYIVRQLW